jgi:two-component system response regulator CpxR
LVAEYLSGEGWDVDAVYRGEEAVDRLAGSERFEAVVLDVMLPGLNGFEVLRRLRATEKPGARTAVIMLTARGDEIDRVLGLEMGADDYLPKPFSSRELAARIRAVVRRTHPEDSQPVQEPPRPVLRVGEYEVDIAAHRVRRGNTPIELTALEMRLLQLLMTRAGTVVTREQIAEDILGRPLLPYDRSVDTHMSNLRRKLTGDEERNPIRTLRGTGYMFVLPEVRT